MKPPSNSGCSRSRACFPRGTPPRRQTPAARRARASSGGHDGPPLQILFALLRQAQEADLESVFLAKGGSLGGAAARAETDFALSCSDGATPQLVTEGLVQGFELEITEKLRDKIGADVRAKLEKQLSQALPEAAAGETDVEADRLFLTDRARLNMTASRVGASINGTLVGTLSGQASIRLQDLFQENVPLKRILDETTNASADGAQDVTQLQALSQMLDALPVAPQVRISTPFIPGATAMGHAPSGHGHLRAHRLQAQLQRRARRSAAPTDRCRGVCQIQGRRRDQGRRAAAGHLQCLVEDVHRRHL